MSAAAAIALYRSVHVLDDDMARALRDVAATCGATAAAIAEALRLRDERVAGDVHRVWTEVAA